MIDLNEPRGGHPDPSFSPLQLLRRLAREEVIGESPNAQEARDIYYNAMEARTEEEHFQMIIKSLQLDPSMVDAWLVLLPHCEFEAEDHLEALRILVTLAERQLGPHVFKEMAGHFYGFHETRPYMRAKEQLAESLRSAGDLEGAITEYEAMLKLNPNDNQGIRYALLASYLALGRQEDASRLFEQYDECDFSTVFAWGRVLERFLAGDLKGAKAALTIARKQNAYAEAYLKGSRRLPKSLPDSYQPGSKEEALCFAESLRMAWNPHPKARQWLAEQTPKPKPKSKSK